MEVASLVTVSQDASASSAAAANAPEKKSPVHKSSDSTKHVAKPAGFFKFTNDDSDSDSDEAPVLRPAARRSSAVEDKGSPLPQVGTYSYYQLILLCCSVLRLFVA
jgi:hypothetical protein